MKAKVKRKLEEQRTEVSEAERLAAFDMVPLPPDTYEKPILWSREVVLQPCRYPLCDEITEGPLCNKHLHLFVAKFRPRLVDRLNDKFPGLMTKLGNGHGVAR